MDATVEVPDFSAWVSDPDKHNWIPVLESTPLGPILVNGRWYWVEDRPGWHPLSDRVCIQRLPPDYPGRVNPRGIVSEEDLELLRVTRAAKDAADAAWRETVVAVASRSSVRSAAKAAKLSPSTVDAWKNPK